MDNYGYVSAMKKYATFSGRSPRREYWMFMLVYLIGVTALSFLDGYLFGYTTRPAVDGVGGSVELNNSIFSMIFVLAHLVPGLAVSVRRLHDIGKSGWWMFIALVPLFGGLILLYWFIKGSEPETNEFGSNPYSYVDASVFGRA